MMGNTSKDFKALKYSQLKAICDDNVRKRFSSFLNELNRRELEVRIKENDTFDSFEVDHLPQYGTGFNDEAGKPVPYFHPNRSFHDEIIWLNDNLFFKNGVTFEDKLINSAVVKFYGPSATLKLMTEGTDWNYVNYNEYKNNPDYVQALMDNLEMTRVNGTKIWGTTELRTSLQTASRNYTRQHPSLVDINGSTNGLVKSTPANEQLERKMRPSDMLHWIMGLSDDWIEFYKSRPDMQKSYEFLTSHRGIGPYYGYHFSSNLARMPGVGSSSIIDIEHGKKFRSLNISHGNLDENADYVVAGPGASATFNSLFPGYPSNHQTTTHAILAIRNNQEDFFEMSAKEIKCLNTVTETGRFTTFGIEISMCQYNVFERCAADSKLAASRAKAPISQAKSCAVPASTPLNIFVTNK